MKFDTTRVLGQVRSFCLMIEKCNPRWILALFVTSLGALLLVELDRRFYSMGKYTVVYINLNYVIVASTGGSIIVRLYNAYRHAVK